MIGYQNPDAVRSRLTRFQVVLRSGLHRFQSIVWDHGQRGRYWVCFPAFWWIPR